MSLKRLSIKELLEGAKTHLRDNFNDKLAAKCIDQALALLAKPEPKERRRANEMDTKQVKQLAIDVNNVASASFQSGKEHTERRLLARIKELKVACRLAQHELLEITNDSYVLAAIDHALKESK